MVSSSEEAAFAEVSCLFGTGESNQAQYDLELPVFQGKLEIQTHT
jgi:hypothetical protein